MKVERCKSHNPETGKRCVCIAGHIGPPGGPNTHRWWTPQTAAWHEGRRREEWPVTPEPEDESSG